MRQKCQAPISYLHAEAEYQLFATASLKLIKMMNFARYAEFLLPCGIGFYLP